ncbi:uncharacterized protein LOC110824781 [Carica papaya]|uniref:uncharacterized protein LOC110824781 n=1 Tax=Carica papaya TaxID=3649 RepID=UPI000B8CA30C|nr:uncharacterized protein LOC110824781 [Carica papaya]
MEVMVLAQEKMELDFNTPRSPSYLTAPPTPRGYGDCFFSAPTSPTRLSEFYRHFDNFSMIDETDKNSYVSVPFDWEDKPGTPKSPKEDDFAFDISGELQKASLSAEELFDGGKIRPLKPPPRLQIDMPTPLIPSPITSPRSPLSQGRKMIREAFSPRKKKDIDPFAAAVENSTRNRATRERGRDRGSQGLATSSSRRHTRSLSPFRVSAYPWEEEEDYKQIQQQPTKQSVPSNSLSSTSSSKASSSSRKWRFKDFLLFRSASEGRAAGKDPLRKYSSSFLRRPEDTKNTSFRSTENSASASGSKRRGRVSAHELHYTTNKAASEDLKKKTFLPYKQGILGRFAFSPSLHALRFGSFTR